MKKMLSNLQALRRNYKNQLEILDISNLSSKDPIKEFKIWLNDAINCKEILEPNAMALATSNIHGMPSVRFLLLKDVNENGFQFFTNSLSKKGLQLAENPLASAVFYWPPLHRQVRIEGTVRVLPPEDADTYFNMRPKESRISAIVSESQSSVIANREVLSSRHEMLSKKYSNDIDVPRPTYWNGYNINPTSIEFWQGQTNRLHDRILFRLAKINELIDENITTKGDGNWLIERLSP